MTKTPEILAKEHTKWYVEHFSKIIEIVYTDAFIHGFKHGKNNK